jgi:RNA polymerase sigma-70 factor (ECF subfamily)
MSGMRPSERAHLASRRTIPPPEDVPEPPEAGDRPESGPSDRALVVRARAGCAEAAGALFERHWPGAWRAALAVSGRRAAADDVAQDAFERAFAALSRFDEARPFAPWLHRIVVNRALDLVRSERRLVGLEGAGELPADWEPDERGDDRALRALAQLSAERRAVVVLRHLLDYSPAEIAEVLELPVGTVHSRLARALAQLRGALEESDERP